MRDTAPPPHKQDNGQDHTHKAMNQRMHRENDHDAPRREPGNHDARHAAKTSASNDKQSAAGQGGRHGLQYYSDEDRRGYGASYRRARAEHDRYERGVHDLQKDGRPAREN